MSNAAFESQHPRESSGQFATKDESRWEAGQVIDLWGEDTGSFEFPPRPRSAADVVSFWRTVQIPESAARAVDSRQRIRAHDAGMLYAKDAQRKYDEECRAARRKPDDDERNNRAHDAYNEGAAVYRKFEQGEVYPSIRAAMMYRDAQYLDDFERTKIETAVLQLPNGPATPKEVWFRHNFEGLENEMVNAEARSMAALEKMADELATIRTIENSREQQYLYDNDLLAQ